jgi:hypothetical protein
MMSLGGVNKQSPLSKVFMHMQAIGDPGQAFCNFILFCVLDKTVRDHVFRACCKPCRTSNTPEERTHLLQGDSNHYNNDTGHTGFQSSSFGIDNHSQQSEHYSCPNMAATGIDHAKNSTDSHASKTSVQSEYRGEPSNDN